MNSQIQNNTLSFGKQALMTCNIKSSDTRTTNQATLYKLDPNNSNDRRDVYLSKNTRDIANDFDKAQYESYPKKDFYMIQNNKTKEVLSCAEVSSHHASADNMPGQYTLIEELQGNKKFNNAQIPLLAYIAKNAQVKSDDYVATAFDDEYAPYLRNNYFTQVQTGEFVIPQDNFSRFSRKMEKKYNIKYVV